MESFAELTEPEFRDTMNDLQANKCILPKGGGHIHGYLLNQEKDCIKIYSNKINTERYEVDVVAERQKLSFQLMVAQNKLVDLQTKEIKTKRLYGFLGAVGGALLGFIAEHYKEILKFFQK